MNLILCHKQMFGLVTISFYYVFVFNHFGFYSKIKSNKKKIKTMHLRQQLLICWFVASTLSCEYVWGVNRDCR